ncbi:MAG: hypothetical protein KC503_18760 [Myxococcales bacterium]|nr:hypothetical protein [Myxococcales bacterium]
MQPYSNTKKIALLVGAALCLAGAAYAALWIPFVGSLRAPPRLRRVGCETLRRMSKRAAASGTRSPTVVARLEQIGNPSGNGADAKLSCGGQILEGVSPLGLRGSSTRASVTAALYLDGRGRILIEEVCLGCSLSHRFTREKANTLTLRVLHICGAIEGFAALALLITLRVRWRRPLLPLPAAAKRAGKTAGEEPRLAVHEVDLERLAGTDAQERAAREKLDLGFERGDYREAASAPQPRVCGPCAVNGLRVADGEHAVIARGDVIAFADGFRARVLALAPPPPDPLRYHVDGAGELRGFVPQRSLTVALLALAAALWTGIAAQVDVDGRVHAICIGLVLYVLALLLLRPHHLSWRAAATSAAALRACDYQSTEEGYRLVDPRTKPARVLEEIYRPSSRAEEQALYAALEREAWALSRRPEAS